MNRKMLEKGIALLVRDAEDQNEIQFNFNTYGYQRSCGTNACAMGLFALRGLGGMSCFFSPGGILRPVLDGNESTWEDLGTRVFEIDRDEYTRLFLWGDGLSEDKGKIAELQVARRIEWFLECGGDMKKFADGLAVGEAERPVTKDYSHLLEP